MAPRDALVRLAWAWCVAPVVRVVLLAVIIYLAVPSSAPSDLKSNLLHTFQSRPFQNNPRSNFATLVFGTKHYYSRSTPSSQLSLPDGLPSSDMLFTRDYFSIDLAYETGSIVVSTPASVQSFSCAGDGVEEGSIKQILVKVGDTDGVSMPWFNTADSALLFQDTRMYVSEDSMAIAQLQSYCVPRGTAATTTGRKIMTATSSKYEHLEWTRSISLIGTGDRPLITVGVQNEKPIWVDLADDEEELLNNRVQTVMMPSHTYPLRRMALLILATIVSLFLVDDPVTITIRLLWVSAVLAVTWSVILVVAMVTIRIIRDLRSTPESGPRSEELPVYLQHAPEEEARK